jgi:hypothetical protein
MSASTRCWHCGTKLSTMGGLHYAVVVTPDGPVRVHKVCRINAQEAVRRLTARPPEKPPVKIEEH